MAVYTTKARESTPFQWLTAGLACWSALFAFDLIRMGARLTSKQWLYILSVPGGKWTWATVFGVAALVVALGFWVRSYRLKALGLVTMSAGCFAFVVLYLSIANAADPVATLGYWPWAVAGCCMSFVAAVNWVDKLW